MSAPAVPPRPRRILHLVSSERWTGVAEPVVSVALHQQRAGCEVWLACIPSRSFEREAKRRGLRVLTDLYLDRRLNPFHVLGDLRFLRRFVERERIDVVHVHLINDHWLAALALRGMRRRRLLARTVHRAEAPPGDPFHRWLFASATDLAIAICEDSRRRIEQKFGLPPPRAAAIHGAVDAERFHPRNDGSAIRRQLRLPRGVALCGLVARMVEGRGHRWLLESFGRLAECAPNLHLVLFGRGPLKQALKKLIRTNPNGARIILGGYRTTDLAEAYAALDFHLLLGPGSDGSCRAALEAMATGKPNVAVRTGVLPEIVRDGVDGLLVEPGDVEALAAALERLAQAPDEVARMGRGAREAVERRFGEGLRASKTLEAYAAAWNARFPSSGGEIPVFP
ncbi:MAG: glycosyltransferase family 4 protein [Candidatus Sumerlaeota bacterium]|nr:glycosyltransferase family 4 protein [Candidatus Sumerlaeota bacterium]